MQNCDPEYRYSLADANITQRNMLLTRLKSWLLTSHCNVKFTEFHAENVLKTFPRTWKKHGSATSF